MEEALLFDRQELKRIPLFKHGESGSQEACGLLKASSDGRKCAVTARAPNSVLHLLELGSTEGNQAKLEGTFTPDTEGEISVCSWSKDGVILAVGTSSGELWVFTRGLEERRSCDQTWGRVNLVALEFIKEGILVITGSGKAFLAPIEGGSKPQMVCNFSRQHMLVTAAVLDQERRIFVVGDGHRSKEDSENPKVGCLQGLTLSVWKLGRSTAQCIFSMGRRPAGQLIRFLFPASNDALPCKTLLSPDSKLLAIAPVHGLLQILSIEEKTLVEAPNLENDISSALLGVQDVSWWSSSLLMIVSKDGKMWFISIPEFKSVKWRPFFEVHNINAAQAITSQFLYTLEPVFNKARHFWGAQLGRISVQTPEQMLGVLLIKGMEQDALELCKNYGLENDQVFCSLWKKHPVDQQSIMSYLEPIHNRVLAVKECVQRVATTSAEERMLLQYGMKVCDELLGDSALGDEDLSESRIPCLVLKLRLLGSSDRLDTFLEINDEGYNEEAFESFKASSLTRAALAFASTGNVHALQILLERHIFTIYENYFEILNELPETLETEKWIHLLPRPNTPPAQLHKPHRSMDRLETKATLEIIQSSEQHSLEATELLLSHQSKSSRSFSADEISSWCIERAKSMDSTTGQLSTVKEFLEQVMSRGTHVEVQQALNDAIVLSSTIKEDCTAWDTGFSCFSDIPLSKKLSHLTKASSPETVTPSLKNKISQLMKGLNRPVRHEALRQFLCDEFKRRPQWVVKFVELEDQEGIAFKSQDSDPVDVCHLVSFLLTAVEPSGNWDKLHELAYIAERSVHFADNVSDEDVTNAKDLLRIVEAGRVLSKYSIHETVQTLQGMDADSIVKLIRLLLSKSARGGRSWSDLKWRGLWQDMNTLASSLHAKTEKDTLLAEYFRALLRAGRTTVAHECLTEGSELSMEQDSAEALVMSVGREFLYSSSSLDDESIIDAKKCFELIPNVQAAKEELHTLDALQQLPQFGFSLVPMQLKQLPGRMDVIPYLLQAQPENYKDLDAVRSIAELLGLRTHEEHLEVDLMIGEAALLAKDYKHAELVASSLIKGGLKRAWRLCSKIVQTGSEHISKVAQGDLLVFAAAHCPDDELVNIIDALNLCQETDESILVRPEAPEEQLDLAISTTPTSVPLNIKSLSMGDIFLALNIIMGSPEVRIDLQNVGTYQKFERASALRLVSYLLKACPKEAVARNVANLSPENLVSINVGGDTRQQFKDISEGVAALKCIIDAAKSARSMKALMPGVDVMRFATEDALDYRQQLVREEAAFAGEMLASQAISEKKVWTALYQALDLSKICKIERAELASIFIVSTIVSVTVVTPAIENTLEEQKQTALEAPGLFASRLCEYAWPDILSHESSKLAYVIQLLGDSQGSERMWSISDMVKEFSDQLEGLDMKLLLNDLIQDISGKADQHNTESALLVEIFGFVDSQHIVALSEFMSKLFTVAPSVQPLSVSTLYLCLVIKQVNLALHDPSHVVAQDFDLESVQDWASLMGHLTSDHIQKLLFWCCLDAEVPLEVPVVDDLGAGLSVSARICALTTGLDLLRNNPTNISEINKLDQELRRLGALDSAQRLTGMTSSDFQALMHEDATDAPESGIDNVIKRLLMSGSKVDVIFEVATSVARARPNMDVANVSEQLIAVLDLELEHALESVLENSVSQGLIIKIVDCLDFANLGDPEAVVPFLFSWRESIWNRLSVFCSSVDGDDLLREHIIRLLELSKDLAEGHIWQKWAQTSCGATAILASKLLFSKTRAHLGSISSTDYSWRNLSSLGECQLLFFRILEGFTGNLSVLSELLRHVWLHGSMWKDLDMGNDQVGVVPLHECWIKLLLKMSSIGDVSGVLYALDNARGEKWLLKRGESIAVWSLISAPECIKLIDALDNNHSKVYVGLLVPFEDIRLSSILQISSIGCDPAILALVLEGGLMSTLLNDPATNEMLYHIMTHAAPHPAVINLWNCSKDAPSMDESKHALIPVSLGKRPVAECKIQDTYDTEWENEWEGSDVDGELDKEANTAILGNLVSTSRRSPVLTSNKESLQSRSSEEPEVGWEKSDDEDWEQTLLEAQRMMDQQNAAEDDDKLHTLENLNANNASTVQLEHLDASTCGASEQAGMSGSKIVRSEADSEMEGGWGEDCDLSETVKAAQQLTRDHSEEDGKGITSQTSSLKDDIISGDGWDDELGDLLEQTQCLSEPVHDAGVTVEMYTSNEKNISTTTDQTEQQRPHGWQSDPPGHNRCASTDWSQGQADVGPGPKRSIGRGVESVDPFKTQKKVQKWNKGDNFLLACLFPVFIAQLCMLDSFMMAVSLVCNKMRLHSGIQSTDAQLAYLREYLKNVSLFPVDSTQYDSALSEYKFPHSAKRIVDRITRECRDALAKLQLLEPE